MLVVPDQYATIGSACQNASAGDTVGVRAGEYYEWAVIPAGVTLLGLEEDPHAIIIQPTEFCPVFTNSGNEGIRIEGVHVLSGSTWNGTCIKNHNEQLVVSGCILETPSEVGEGMVVLTTSADCTIRSCEIITGLGTWGLVAVSEVPVHLLWEDCVFLGHPRTGPWASRYGSTYELRNNTFFAPLEIRGFDPQHTNCSLFLVNNIFHDFACIPGSLPDVLELRCNDFVHGPPIPECGYQVGNFQADPLFCDPGAEDYRLQPGSPCIGAGEGGEDVGARLGICWPTAVDEAAGSARNGSRLSCSLSPNPMVSGTEILLGDLPRGPSTTLSIEILDLTGSVVQVMSVTGGQKTQRIRWEGRTADGNPVPAGVYHVRVRVAGEMVTAKLIVLR